MWMKKLLLVFLTITLIFLILLAWIFPIPNNVGKSITLLKVKNDSKVLSLSKKISIEKKKIVIFYSLKCPTCEKLLTDTSFVNHSVLVNIDFNISTPKNTNQLIPSKRLEIYYTPYIIEVDSSMIITREIKASELEEINKKKEYL